MKQIFESLSISGKFKNVFNLDFDKTLKLQVITIRLQVLLKILK